MLVLPNTADEERSQKYTTPIKLFEYMASGVPIIASRVPSFDTYLKHNNNAYLFEPDNPENLAKQVNDLLKDRYIMKKISKQAKRDVAQYDWRRRAETIVRFINF